VHVYKTTTLLEQISTQGNFLFSTFSSD